MLYTMPELHNTSLFHVSALFAPAAQAAAAHAAQRLADGLGDSQPPTRNEDEKAAT